MIVEIDGLSDDIRSTITGTHACYGSAFYSFALQRMRIAPGSNIDAMAPRSGGIQMDTGHAQRGLRRRTGATRRSPAGDISWVANEVTLVYSSDTYSALGGMGADNPAPMLDPNPPGDDMEETLECRTASGPLTGISRRGTHAQPEYGRLMEYVDAVSREIRIPYRDYDEEGALYSRVCALAKVLYGQRRAEAKSQAVIEECFAICGGYGARR